MKLIVILSPVLLFGCTGAAGDISKGQVIYKQNCISCHNTNPSKVGSIGPELTSTPLEVFRTKVPHGKYPEGYTPKRSTNAMPKFKRLEKEVEHIYNYVKSFKKTLDKH